MLTKIRKIYRECCFDPKITGTEWSISYRDMTCNAHILRAKQLITFYHEGAKGIESLNAAIWHLACALVKYNGD